MEKDLKRKIQVVTAQKKLRQKWRKILQAVDMDELGRKICHVEPGRSTTETQFPNLQMAILDIVKPYHISSAADESRQSEKLNVSSTLETWRKALSYN